VNTATPNIIEQWKFIPGAQNYTLSGSLTNQNYTAVLVGEVDGDWVAPGGTSSAPQQAASSISEPEDAAAIDIETNTNQTNANDVNVNQLGIEKSRREDKESIKYALPSATGGNGGGGSQFSDGQLADRCNLINRNKRHDSDYRFATPGTDGRQCREDVCL
jgi:hypothetical protein